MDLTILYILAGVGILNISALISYLFRNIKYYTVHKTLIKDEKDILIQSLKERNEFLKQENSELKKEVNKISTLIYNSLQD